MAASRLKGAGPVQRERDKAGEGTHAVTELLGSYSSCHTPHISDFQCEVRAVWRGSGKGKENITLHLSSTGQFLFPLLHLSERRLRDIDMRFLSPWIPELESWVGLGFNYMRVRVHINTDMNTAWVCSQGPTQPPKMRYLQPQAWKQIPQVAGECLFKLYLSCICVY